VSAKKKTKTARVHHAVETSGFVRHFVTKNAVICAHSNLAKVKLCRISFGADGSVYVSFPYLKTKRGLVSRVTSEQAVRDAAGNDTYDLHKSGVVVETDVKFTHHSSGETHFSLTGLQTPLPEQPSFPLGEGDGLLFELHVYWLGGFKWIEKKADKDLYLNTRFDGPHPVALRVQGHWWRKSGIVANLEGEADSAGFIGPRAEVVHRPTGRVHGFFLLAPPNSPFADHVLGLTVDRVLLPEGADVPTMLFLGPPSGDGRLVFMYPCAEAVANAQG